MLLTTWVGPIWSGANMVRFSVVRANMFGANVVWANVGKMWSEAAVVRPSLFRANVVVHHG